MNTATQDLHETETRLLDELRTLRRGQRERALGQTPPPLSVGQRVADTVAATMGSWRFIIIQTTILVIWIALNVFFGLFGGMPGAGGESVAWVAHIAGFLFGLAAIRFFAPRTS